MTPFYRETRHPWFHGQVSFTEIENGQVLFQKILAKGEPSQKKAWIFDLDSTLFCTTPRNREIFRSYLEYLKDFPPEWKLAIEKIHPSKHSFNIRESIEWALQEFVGPEVAYKHSKEIWKDYKDYWEHHFFADTYMDFDEPYAGAQALVKRVWDAGYSVIYLTGRDTARSLGGTEASLAKWKFPRGERTDLILKPGFRWGLGDSEFKDIVSRQLSDRFEILCSIDNEPENLWFFAKHFPKAEIVLFHSVMSERVPDEDIHAILGQRPLWLLKNF